MSRLSKSPGGLSYIYDEAVLVKKVIQKEEKGASDDE